MSDLDGNPKTGIFMAWLIYVRFSIDVASIDCSIKSIDTKEVKFTTDDIKRLC